MICPPCLFRRPGLREDARLGVRHHRLVVDDTPLGIGVELGVELAGVDVPRPRALDRAAGRQQGRARGDFPTKCGEEAWGVRPGPRGLGRQEQAGAQLSPNSLLRLVPGMERCGGECPPSDHPDE